MKPSPGRFTGSRIRRGRYGAPGRAPIQAPLAAGDAERWTTIFSMPPGNVDIGRFHRRKTSFEYAHL